MTGQTPDLPPTLRHFAWRKLCMCGFALAGLVCAVFLFLIGLAIRLSFGPIALGPSIGVLSGALSHALPAGIVMHYDTAAIEWSKEETRISLVVLGTEVDEADGSILVRAPKAEIDLAAWPLLRGSVEVQRIALVGIQVAVVHAADGSYRLGLGPNRADRNLLSELRQKMAAAKGPSTLKSFSARHSDLTYADETLGLRVRSQDANIRLTRGALGEQRIGIDATVRADEAQGKLKATIILPQGDGLASGRIALSDIVLSDDARAAPKVKSRADGRVDPPLSADVDIVFAQRDAGGGARVTVADIVAGAAGHHRFVASNTDVSVRRFDVKGHYDGRTNIATLQSACIDSTALSGCLSGAAHFERDDRGLLARIGLDVTLRDGVVAVPKAFAAPTPFGSGHLKGAWDVRARRFDAEVLDIRGGAFALQARGAVSVPPRGSPGIDVDGTIERLNVRDLVRYWPLDVAPGARSWVDANMSAGAIGPLSIALHIREGALDAPHLDKDAVAIVFPIADAEANYLDGLPHMTRAFGKAVLSGTDFAIDVASAKIGALTIPQARFYIPDINAAVPLGQIDGRIVGSVPDVLRLIDKKPLRYPTHFGLDPNATGGAANVELHMRIPLSDTVSFDQIAVQVRAVTKNVSVTLGDLHLSDGDMVFAVTNTDLRATGTTGIGGSASRLTVDWREDFDRAKPTTTEISVKGAMDATAREGLGLYADEYFRGPVLVNGTLSGRAGGLRQGTLTVDLTPAVVSVAHTAIAKPAGFPLSGRLDLNFAAHTRLTTANVHLQGAGNEIVATATFAADGGLSGLQVPTCRFGPRNDFSFNLVRTHLGTDMALHAVAFDGTQLFRDDPPAKTGKSGGRPQAEAPFYIAASIDKLMMRSSVVVSNVRLEMGRVGDRLTGFKLKGSLGHGATVSGTMVAGEKGRTLHLSVQDAGTLLNAQYGFASMRGGSADLQALLPDGGEIKGTLKFKKFHIVDQPFLTRLFTVGSLGGMINLMQGDGIAVDDLEIPFSMRNRVIDIRDARATGPAIGISAEGFIDLVQSRVGVKGTLVPLYTLNSVLGNIPVLGDVLTSKTGEGIIGMSYAIKGNLDEPTIVINPLSVLAPGILRRLFEGSIPKATQSPPAQPEKK